MTNVVTLKGHDRARHLLNDHWENFDYLGVKIGDTHYVVRTSEVMSSVKINKCVVLPTKAFRLRMHFSERKESIAEIVEDPEVLDSIGAALNLHRIEGYDVYKKRKIEKGEITYLGFYADEGNYIFDRGNFFTSEREIDCNILVPTKALRLIAYDHAHKTALTQIMKEQQLLDSLAQTFSRLGLESEFYTKAIVPTVVKPTDPTIDYRANKLGSMFWFGERLH